MLTRLTYLVLTAHAQVSAARFFVPPIVLLTLFLVQLSTTPDVRAQAPPPTPEPIPTVAPVYAEPDWEPAHLEYPVGWGRAETASVQDLDSYTRCHREYGQIRDPVEREWRKMNCQVRRVVEGIVAASVGVALLTVAWAGFTYMLESQDQSSRGRSKMAVLTALGALCITLLSFVIAGLLDNGIIPHSPWATETLRR